MLKKMMKVIMMSFCVGGLLTGCKTVVRNDVSINEEMQSAAVNEVPVNVGMFNLEDGVVLLNSGYEMPILGIGTYRLSNEQAEDSVYWALKDGYRLIDTARIYGNEEGVGKGIQKAINEGFVSREEIFVTTKMWTADFDHGDDAVAASLKRLNLEYIDLLLLHQQFGDYLGAWKDMEKAVALGKVKSIGLSNFESDRLEDVLAHAVIQPSVLQVECHPYHQQSELKKRLAKCGAKIESWYPIGHGDKGLINEPLFTKLAEKYHKTNVQIILRWHIQEGNIVFPRTTNPQHMKENFDIFDFALTDEEMNEIGKFENTKRFFNMTLAEQEQNLSAFHPAD